MHYTSYSEYLCTHSTENKCMLEYHEYSLNETVHYFFKQINRNHALFYIRTAWEYVDLEIVANVYLFPECKYVMVPSIFYHLDDRFWGCEKKIQGGSSKSFKKLSYSLQFLKVIQKMVGDNIKVHFGGNKKRFQKSIQKTKQTYTPFLDKYTPIPKDLYDLIIYKVMKNPTFEKVTQTDLTYMNQEYHKHCNKKTGLYKWFDIGSVNTI